MKLIIALALVACVAAVPLPVDVDIDPCVDGGVLIDPIEYDPCGKPDRKNNWECKHLPSVGARGLIITGTMSFQVKNSKWGRKNIDGISLQ